MNAIAAGSLVEQAHRRGRLRQRHCSRLTGVYAIEAGSLFEQVFERAIEAGSLTEQAHRRGQSSNAPLKQAHWSNWLTKEVDFGYAIEAGSLFEQVFKRH